MQVEMAALELRASRLVRGRDAASGQRGGFGEQGASAVVSARFVHDCSSMHAQT